MRNRTQEVFLLSIKAIVGFVRTQFGGRTNTMQNVDHGHGVRR